MRLQRLKLVLILTGLGTGEREKKLQLREREGSVRGGEKIHELQHTSVCSA